MPHFSYIAMCVSRDIVNDVAALTEVRGNKTCNGLDLLSGCETFDESSEKRPATRLSERQVRFDIRREDTQIEKFAISLVC